MDEPFELIEQVGRGGMGVVWKARETETGQIVALKLLHSMFADDPDYVARFEREVEVARRIESPYVVNVVGYGMRDGVPFMAMDFVEGHTLRDLLKARGRLSWEETRDIAEQVAKGLDAAHKVGVIHRDVKPSNILITPEGHVKLADFGIARAADLTRLTGGATMLGTPTYMAPENETTAQSDLYALGCVMFEMLVGQPPFTGDTQQQIMLKHLRQQPMLSELPRQARPLIGSLLQKTPSRRPRTAADVIALLNPEEATRPLPVVTKTDISRVKTGISRRVALASLVVGVVAVAGLVFLLKPGSKSGGGDGTPTAISTANVVDSGTNTPVPTRPAASPTSNPPKPTATTAPPPPSSGPVVTSSDWSPAHAQWGDQVTITLQYKSGDAPITKVQLHETGQNADGTQIYWGSINNYDGKPYDWTADNYIVFPWDVAANSSDTYTLTLNCLQGDVMRSKMFITFIDSLNRTSQTNISVPFICSQTGN
ncbi:MAG: serine/threonine protein kinase [Tepidiformaceae bacterium]